MVGEIQNNLPRSQIKNLERVFLSSSIPWLVLKKLSKIRHGWVLDGQLSEYPRTVRKTFTLLVMPPILF